MGSFTSSTMQKRYGVTQIIGVAEMRIRSRRCAQNVYTCEEENVLLIINAKKMHYFSTLFGKELYMFRTDLLSFIKSLNL